MDFVLSNGSKMPLFGFGTYLLTKPEEIQVLKQAIVEQGYRHIDTASIYGNEERIGEILQEIFATTPIKREDMYIVTKLFCTEKQDVTGALQGSLKRLKMDYVDLYLVHQPGACTPESDPLKNPVWIKVPQHVVWAGMEECVSLGLTKSIGVSNFNFQLLSDLLAYAKIRPVCNQIELHPYLVQHPFVEWMKQEHILPVSYGSLCGTIQARSNFSLLTDPVIGEIAQNRKATPGQVLLAWSLARGHAVIPKTGNLQRSLENISAKNFKLDQEDVDKITSLDKNFRFYDPSRLKYFGGIPMFY